ncbi:sodium:proton antiporter [Phyllobacterium sp. 628]|uniref:cation:proton antiporter n=1 Tax=Phyllobacterium sp. 628 TaxID=2718938 RepID=UPI0016622C35|nr:cation:proton antiporter [Phyllobacterium sp. 628]QND52182.1 sodium:proton antiporter [Phyllobacterium sp. 628]
MALFENMLVLMLVAIIFLQLSRTLAVPYPTMLAVAGVIVASLPWAPDISIDPQLAMALFIAPALLDAAYDLPPRTIRRDWVPLVSLAVWVVILTTAAVAWVGVSIGGLPLAAAIALGAIVAPPDAAAAAAMLGRFALPRRAVAILQGESLLNDATSLLIFSAAVGVAMGASTLLHLIPLLIIAVPGGLLFGFVSARIAMLFSRHLAGTLGGTLFEFVAVFGTWIIAEHLHLSAILAVVAFAMTTAHYVPARQAPRARLHSYSVWQASVFLLNVLAFLLMGLQARAIVLDLAREELSFALMFAGIVFVTVVLVRIAWVLTYNRLVHYLLSSESRIPRPPLRMSLVVSWCGMRGLVTLATALALPAAFPSRELIVLSALAVVLGSLIVQGLTLGPLIRLLGFKPDTSLETDLAKARVTLLDTAIRVLDKRDDNVANRLRETYEEARALAADGRNPRAVSQTDQLQLTMIAAKREKLAAMRHSGAIDDDVFHALEQDLDFAELAALPPEKLEIIDG